MSRVLFVIAFMFSSTAFAAQITCNIAAEVDGKSVPTKVIRIDVDSDQKNCVKQASFTLPGTQVEVTMYGHGDCNPGPDMCTNDKATVGGMEIHDKASGNYTHTYGSCSRVIGTDFLQLISNGNPRVNVVVSCELHN